MSNFDIQLSLQSVCYRYKNHDVLNDITLDFNGSGVITLLGPNGAGKSTLLKIIANQLLPTSGEIQLKGGDLNQHRLGYMPEAACLMPELSVFECLQYTAFNSGVGGAGKVKSPEMASKATSVNVAENSSDRLNDLLNGLLDLCQLKAVKNKRTNTLSMGYRQRLNLAQALIGDPQILVLDEPLNGLDPMLIREFRDILNQLKLRKMILMSTHYLAEAEMVSDQVVFMNSGQLIKVVDAVGSVKNLEQQYVQAFEGVSA